jgi:hypothetical protein
MKNAPGGLPRRSLVPKCLLGLTRRLAFFQNEGNGQVYLIGNVAVIPYQHVLVLDPSTFDVAQGLRGTLDTLIDSILEALV